MELTPEEREIYERELARCRYRAQQLRELEAPHENQVALEAAWEPLLRRPPLPDPPCAMPYYAPELIP
jgi:hypothetical protein